MQKGCGRGKSKGDSCGRKGSRCYTKVLRASLAVAEYKESILPGSPRGVCGCWPEWRFSFSIGIMAKY